MPCLSITNGLFINAGPGWQSGNATASTANGATVTNTAGGANPGCSVVKGASSVFIGQPLSGSVRFMIFGNPANFVAILTVQGGVGSVARSVVIVDVSGSTISTNLISSVSAPSTVSLPAINPSQGNGSVFGLFSSNGSGPLANVAASIHRSSDGHTFCAAVPFHPTAQVLGQATATALEVLHGATVVASAVRPVGKCAVATTPLVFPDAIIGPGVAPALAVRERTVQLRNDGDDCLTISGVGNVAPYSVVSTTPTLPVTLDPGGHVDVQIRFDPGAIGTFNRDLPITRTPGNGDAVIACRGQGRAATLGLSFGGTLAFPVTPVASSTTRNLVVTNSGEATVNLTIPSAITGTEFAVPGAAFVGPLAPGASTPNIPITFTPPGVGSFARVLTFTSNAPGSPHQISLQGAGCLPRAVIEIDAPSGPAVALGQVQRGFRTVRLVRVRNTGSGPLSFRARVTGNPLFGLQREDGSITQPLTQSLFDVNPVNRCGAGATGLGEVVFAVTFFANDVPGIQNAQLVVDNHNDQTAGVPASFTFDLQAEIVAAISADVELVMDRSGSMNDSSGPRRKIDTALDAARLFVQLGRPDVDDRIGTSRFNTVPEQVQAITAITTANQGALVNGITLGNFTPSGGTAIAGGVIQALRDMNNNPRPIPPPQLNKAIVVLTDANDNTTYVNPDDGVGYRLLAEAGATPVPVPPDVAVYGIGIGDAVDTGRLAQLCPTTGGQFLHVHDFSGLDFFKLEKHFTQIYMATVDLAQIVDPTYWIQPNETHEHSFCVLRGDVNVMVVIYDRDGARLPFWLVTPSGELIEPTSIPPGFQIRPGITNTARFIEVRLPQGEPDRYAGQWKVVIRHEGKLCFADGDARGTKWISSDQGESNAHQGAAFGFTSTRCKPSNTEPAMYGIAIGAGSNFRMTPFVEPGIKRVGESIRLNALVSEFTLPVLGCTVTVEAKPPGGGVTTLTLHDDGGHQDGAASDGDYGGLFTATSQEGMYEFLFRARGKSRDGEPVVREMTLSKYVEGRAKLEPTEPDQQGGDKDECCVQLRRWLMLIAIFLLLLLVVTIWIAVR